MEHTCQLVRIYEKLSNLRSKIRLKSAGNSKIKFIINLFGKKFGIYRINTHPAGAICLKNEKYLQVTRKIDLATKRIFILLD